MIDLSPPVHTADLRAVTARIIKAALRAMARDADDTTLKQCIMTAREHGHLTDEETGFYITYWGLANA